MINRLNEMSYNLYWSWNNDFFELFGNINSDLWEWCDKNPVKFLDSINRDFLSDTIGKKNLQGKILSMFDEYKKYLSGKTYFQEKYYNPESPSICYLSAEYALAKCMKFYSGGLGTLSGDHMKSASDLGIPLIGIGLAYLYGYFRQYITKEGRQGELYDRNDFNKLPMYLVRDKDYIPIKISVFMNGRNVYAQVWAIEIGRIKLYMLDTFVVENHAEDKRITDILYGGDREDRIRQEILLGIGGMRVVEKLGLDIKAYHINEGHSAFLTFERIKNFMHKYNVSYKEAKEVCYYSNIFTTHTPVPAGIDIFPKWLMEKYFKNYAENEVGMSFIDLFNEGDLRKGHRDNDEFNMAYLAINNSNFVNGVSKLHGEIARSMWSLPPDRSQIDYVTNGVHTQTYLSSESERIISKNFGKQWYKDENKWDKISSLPDESLWKMRNRNRTSLIKCLREKIEDKHRLAGADDEKLSLLKDFFDENALTIGFARRFAQYKRGKLLFMLDDRLKKILGNSDRKVQVIFSGKAHPKDEPGKQLIFDIYTYTGKEGFSDKVVFIENYDIEVAKKLVSGCDLWLNNPRRPLEASGTSGMKVVANGGLNFSILDGWWCEGYTPENGWAITSAPEGKSEEEVDWLEANAIYDILENEIIPAFYNRDEKGIPTAWINKIRASIKTLAPVYNTDRMLWEYTEKFYMKVK